MADGLRSTCFGAVWTWRGWFAVQREARAFPRIRPRLGPINTASGQRQKLCNTVVTVFESRDAEPASVSHREVDRPTAHGASDAVRTWRGCVVGQHAAHSSPRRRPRHDPTDYATGRRRKLRNILINMFDSHGARPTHVRYRPTRRARATQSGLTAVVVWPNALRAPPHAGGRVSTPPKARLIGGRGSEMSCSLRLNTVARDPRAYYPV